MTRGVRGKKKKRDLDRKHTFGDVKILAFFHLDNV